MAIAATQTRLLTVLNTEFPYNKKQNYQGIVPTLIPIKSWAFAQLKQLAVAMISTLVSPVAYAVITIAITSLYAIDS
ncbi:hypothetical protein M2404_001090 [Rheinheimera pacifica]|uniref:hypothetical protein n=1 Tax=Rheinheimera pacifica TaxID=173990 RepID=UPI0021685CAB|nr:hypothetical protein [Rheinheimera pacifica]MCS4306765.1 hypothetical protein [Rheinheimera pacifica]